MQYPLNNIIFHFKFEIFFHWLLLDIAMNILFWSYNIINMDNKPMAKVFGKKLRKKAINYLFVGETIV